MNKFKVGDRVRVISTTTDHTYVVGKVGIITGGEGVRGNWLGVEDDNGYDFPVKFGEEELELVSKRGRPAKEKEVMFIATYDVNDVDPHKTFTSRKELTDWLKEAKEDTSIKFSSIKVYEVKKELQVITSFKLKYVKK